MKNHGKVVLGMSGGVDSSTAALLLKEAGFSVIGLMLNLWTADNGCQTNRCCSPDAQKAAQRVASQLDIPFYVVDARQQFYENVVEPFKQEIYNGRTPNPCWICNVNVRWAFFHKYKSMFDAVKISTGHYARLRLSSDGNAHLLKATDASKDQSYILSSLTQHHLRDTIFPLGELWKQDVRKHAEKLNLEIASKPDSQDLCFLGELRYEKFLHEFTPEAMKPGKIIDTNGKTLGVHDGLGKYTIGQRKGIKIGNTEPLYVLAKNLQKDLLIVGTKDRLIQKQFTFSNVNWIIDEPDASEFHAHVMVRYRSALLAATITKVEQDVWKISLNDEQAVITPGQIAVLYNNDEVLGSGVINELPQIESTI